MFQLSMEAPKKHPKSMANQPFYYACRFYNQKFRHCFLELRAPGLQLGEDLNPWGWLDWLSLTGWELDWLRAETIWNHLAPRMEWLEVWTQLCPRHTQPQHVAWVLTAWKLGSESASRGCMLESQCLEEESEMHGLFWPDFRNLAAHGCKCLQCILATTFYWLQASS